MGNGLDELKEGSLVLMHSFCPCSTLEQTKEFALLANAAICYSVSSTHGVVHNVVQGFVSERLNENRSKVLRHRCAGGTRTAKQLERRPHLTHRIGTCAVECSESNLVNEVSTTRVNILYAYHDYAI